MLGRWADVMLVAPLSCNTLAKMANGFAIICCWPLIFLLPARLLWLPQWMKTCGIILQQNQILQKLQSFGNNIIPVEKGELASGLYGRRPNGRTEDIVEFIERNFFLKKDLKVKKYW